jgi:transposase
MYSIILFCYFNPLSPELNPICYLLALLAQNFLHVSGIRVKSLTLRLLMSYIYRVFKKELYNFCKRIEIYTEDIHNVLNCQM